MIPDFGNILWALGAVWVVCLLLLWALIIGASRL